VNWVTARPAIEASTHPQHGDPLNAGAAGQTTKHTKHTKNDRLARGTLRSWGKAEVRMQKAAGPGNAPPKPAGPAGASVVTNLHHFVYFGSFVVPIANWGKGRRQHTECRSAAKANLGRRMKEE
jgi:hypothetical protein